VPGTGLGHSIKWVAPEFIKLIGLASISRRLPGKINTKMKNGHFYLGLHGWARSVNPIQMPTK
jgi:hypothetical protein